MARDTTKNKKKKNQPKKVNLQKDKPAKDINNEQQSKVGPSDIHRNDTEDHLETTVCCICLQEDGTTIVECDECKRWFCFKCANLDQIGEEDPWSCDECLSKRLQEEESNQISQGHSKRATVESTYNSQQPRLDDISEDYQQEFVDSTRTHVFSHVHPSNRVTRSEKSTESMEQDRRTFVVSVDVHQPLRLSPRETEFHVISTENRQLSSTVRSHHGIALKPSDSNKSTSMPIVGQLSSQNSVKSKRQDNFQRKSEIVIKDTIDADSEKSQSILSKITSSKSKATSSSRQSNIEQRLREELELQTRLDEERVALKLEALALKESRERKFLKEKFKRLSGSEADGDSTVTTSSRRRSTDINLSNRTLDLNKSEFVSSWVKNQNQDKKVSITPSEVYRQRYEKRIDEFNLDYSIEVDHEELKRIQQRLDEHDQRRFRESQNPKHNEFLDPDAPPFKLNEPNSGRNLDADHANVNAPTSHNQERIPRSRVHVLPERQEPDWIIRSKHSLPPPYLTTVEDEHNRPSYINSFEKNRQSMEINRQNRQSVQINRQSVPTNQENPQSVPINQETHQSRQIGQENRQSVLMKKQNSQPLSQPILSQRSQQVDHGQIESGSQIGNETNGLSGYPPPTRRLLTANHIAARHVIVKKLPLFYGDPAQWTEFIDKYNSTTDACGFDNTENLDRLYESLQGNAREVVRAHLTNPTSVPYIIDILEQKFGRPELIVKAFLKAIRAEPIIKSDKLEALCNFGYKVQNLCHQIQRQKMPFYLHNPELIQEIVDKLPYQTKIEWARDSDNIQNVTLVTLSNWLVELSRSLNKITTPEVIVPEKKTDRKSENFKGGTFLNAHNANNSTDSSQTSETKEANRNMKCEYCPKGCKNLAECTKFKGISIDEKWKFLYGHKKLCRCCLRAHKKKCTKTKECGVNGCSYKHHPMLHDKEKMLKTKNSNQKSNQPSGQNSSHSAGKSAKENGKTNSSCNAHRGGQAVLYKIIPVTLKNGNKTVSTHAYMDDGSGLTLMESELAKELDLKGTHQKLCLRWTSGTVRHETDSMRVVLEIAGEGESQHNYQIRDVRTVKSLDLPKQIINKNSLIKNYPYLERIPFQDFEAAPRILIGLDNVKLGISREHVEGKWMEPIASKTLLGWVVHGPNGPISTNESQNMQHHVLSINQCLCQTERDDELHKEIEEFFSLENFGIRALNNSVESKDVQRAITIMEKTTVRRNNRFETGLLWKFDDVKLPNNFKMAMKRLECQDRRMQSNPELMENINNQIHNFIVKGYARKLETEEVNIIDQRIWYLPIFHHLDPKKPEKVRLVWDAAAKFRGISLNSMLMPGPDNLVALIDILRRFREKCVAIGGDIEEMYHQVQVRKQDRNSQRFLWRDGKLGVNPEVYVMNVLTFGTNCSPSLAQNVKNKNASDFEEKYPKAAKAIKENHYVDDWLDSQHTVEEAIRLAKEVKFVHQQGGFNLRKIISNSEQVLKALGENNGQTTKYLNDNATIGKQKVLGMWWDAQTDCFTYSLKYTKLNEEVLLGLRAPTKREVLKTLMSIYDPLGLIGFYLIYLKIILQEVWKTKVAWDQQLPHELDQKWKRWVKFLPSVEKVRVPRLYSNKISPGTAQSTELHTFVDASENAYCAVCYLRITDQEGVDCVLIGAKTKVAPIKPLTTIPRLELLAAVLGTRLSKSIGDSLTLIINKRYFWSDSRDVLCWIRSTTRKYRQFVAFRVGEILEASNESEWRWVPGKLNVADDGTKWSKNPNFDQNCRWFCGPEFLIKDESSWPHDLLPEEVTEEELHVHLVHGKLHPPSDIVPEHFSKWSRLINAQALSTRYLKKLIAKIKGQSLVGPLEAEELRKAECTLYKLAQFDCFYDEITTLKNTKQEFGAKSCVKKSSPIYKCSPYLEQDGLLRIRGRIDNIRGVKFQTKRPIIMPRSHKITELIVNNYHRMYLHRNNETVINELKQKFFIPKIRVVLKKVISRCQTCKNNRAKPTMPEMGNLPVARLSPGLRAFTFTGVDYFGPMNVVVKRGTEKRWGVLFTCLTVRAIHIEISPSLSADSCILCVRNFTNLRGTPIEFYSDNGTNFKAADKELSEEFEKLDKDKIQSHYTRTYTKWNFNPPASPHFGGSWERLIGTVKENLKMVMFTRTPKEELLRSYLLEIVNIINSRPLTYVQIDSTENEALTPNHFIFGSSNGHKAPGEFPFEEKSLTKSWRRSQELTNIFWRRWIKEYLPTLTCRSKWFPKAKPIEIGDVVLLVDEQNARNSYPKGIVLDVQPDKHGQIRSATIKIAEVIPGVQGRTKDAPVRYSIKTRPVAKLAVLDVAGKPNDVKPVGAATTKCLNGEENVTDGNNITDNAKISNPRTKKEKSVKGNPAIIRRSKRILDQTRNKKL